MNRTRRVPGKRNQDFVIALVCLALMTLTIVHITRGVPTGPVISYLGNSTSASSGNPTIENNASIKGGVIATVNLEVRQQDSHWKAYIGNVTGKYILEDASNYSIYEWDITTIAGEVYATRRSSSVSWSNVVCANITHVLTEMSRMHHNSTNTPGDSINETFSGAEANDHWGFYAGDKQIVTDSCNFSINTYINDSAQTTTDWFDEVLLYDNAGNIIYATKIEDDRQGYRYDNITTYDFQLLVAENASPATDQTDYYFYVELS